jgi:hypothetical protein
LQANRSLGFIGQCTLGVGIRHGGMGIFNRAVDSIASKMAFFVRTTKPPTPLGTSNLKNMS